MVNSKALSLCVVVSCATLAGAQENVLYDFHMPSCAPCRRMDPTIQQLVAAGYPVRKVDITGTPEERAIARLYGITKVPSFVMVAAGREVGRINGPTSYEQLEQMLRLAQSPAPLQEPSALTAAVQDSIPIASTSENGNSWNDPQDTLSQDSVYSEPKPKPNPTSIALNPFDARLVNASVRIRVEDANGHSWATGTMIDSRSGEALIITCGHIFRASQGKGRVLVDLYEALPNGLRQLSQVEAQVINFNLETDLGLVSIRPGFNVRVAEIAAPGATVQKFDAVTSVGCDHGANPTVQKTHITSIDRYLGPSKIEVQGTPAEGRSGGGLFDAEGRLVGVCNFADPSGNAGLFAAISSIHAELDQIGLAEIYQKSQPIAAALSPLASAVDPRANSEIQAEFIAPAAPTELQPVRPVVDNHLAEQFPALPLKQDGSLTKVEQAAFEEIMDHAAKSEVVCIIRPKTPGAKSQILTLGNVSGAFVQQLTESSANSIALPPASKATRR